MGHSESWRDNALPNVSVEGASSNHCTSPKVDRSPKTPKSPSFYLGEEEDKAGNDIQKPSINISNYNLSSELKVPKRQDKLPPGRQKLSISTNLHPSRNTNSSSFLDSQLVVSSQREPFSNIDNILQFPIESSHAYSYAHLSPNSLALRLNVLKRSLQILKDRPSLYKSMSVNRENNDDSLTTTTTNEGDFPSIDPMMKKPNPNARYSVSSIGSNSSYDSDNVKLSQLINYNDTDDKLLNSFKSGNRPSSFYRNPLANNSGDLYLPIPDQTNNLNNNNKLKLQSNASSAALAAFFRPPMKRSDSLPVNQLYSHKFASASSLELQSPEMKESKSRSASTSSTKDSKIQKSNKRVNKDLKDIVQLLEDDELALANHTDIASTLHDLSLSSNKEEDQRLKQDFLKNKLIYALATPFVETSVMTSALLGAPSSASSAAITPLSSNFKQSGSASYFNQNFSSATLNSLNITPSVTQPASAIPGSNGNNRTFHSISLGKHAAPQSVFTVELDSPWSLKAANDLACLMFGVSKNTIRSLTLMDLIAPQFRNFVTERLTRVSNSVGLKFKSKNQERSASLNIIFAGEIIAISRPGDKQYAWTSMWAKRRGDLIIIMFDQIPCDAFDVVILCDKENYTEEGYKIQSIDEIAGKLINKRNRDNINRVEALSEAIDKDLKQNNDDPEDNSGFINYYLPQDISDSEKINRTRYYTLQIDGDENGNIPCAVTSNPLEINPDKYEIKLKFHTLPYIAGIFVLRATDLKILSCNNAIAKNLFGRSFDELTQQSIDYIIPKFSEILQTGLEMNDDAFNIVPGLVLPEHFFRRYDAVLRYENEAELDDNDEPLSEEELFLGSHGIVGLHRDGKPLFIDVQLRVSANDTYVLWVTYSRQSSKNNHDVSKELDKLSTTTSSLSLSTTSTEKSPGFKRSRLNSSDDIDDVGLPSQLKLLPDNEADILELSYSSAEVSRQNSTRRPKANTFAIPIRHLNDALADAVSPERIVSKPNSKNRTISNNDSIMSRDDDSRSSSPTNTAASSTSGIDSNTGNKETEEKDQGARSPALGEIMSYKKYSEEAILNLENTVLAEKMEKSTQWPQKIGAKKRSKKFSEFNVLKDMGEGAYGKVVLAQHKEDSVYKIIIKCIDKERILVDTWVRDRSLGTIPSEIQIMAFLNNEPHPNIMRIIDYFEDPKYYYLETPIFGDPPAIDLFDFIEIKKDMTELECQFIFKQIVLAIYHLHKNGIVHRDIKDENIIVDENGIIKLIDFGSAGYTKLGPFDVFVGTIDYASPEVLRGEKYEGKPQDIWALGILLYTLLYKENPFYNVDEIMEGDLRVPGVISDKSLNLIKRILNKEVDQRPTITDIVEDEWLDI